MAAQVRTHLRTLSDTPRDGNPAIQALRHETSWQTLQSISHTATAYSSVPLGSTNVRLMVAFVGLNLWYFTSSGCAMMFSANFKSVWTTRHTRYSDRIIDENRKWLYLEGLHGDVAGVWAQDTRVYHSPELLPLFVIAVKACRRCCCCCPLSLHPQSTLNGCRHSIMVGTSLRCLWFFDACDFGVHDLLRQMCDRKERVSQTQ